MEKESIRKPKKTDALIPGARFGRLEIIERLPESKIKCHCDCGNEVILQYCHVLYGKQRSCGCLLREAVSARRKGKAPGKRTKPSGKTGILGVGYKEDIHKYVAYIIVSGKNYHLGVFGTSADAQKARKEAEKRKDKGLPIIPAKGDNHGDL